MSANRDRRRIWEIAEIIFFVVVGATPKFELGNHSHANSLFPIKKLERNEHMQNFHFQLILLAQASPEQRAQAMQKNEGCRIASKFLWLRDMLQSSHFPCFILKKKKKWRGGAPAAASERPMPARQEKRQKTGER